jgi:ribosomal protein S14
MSSEDGPKPSPRGALSVRRSPRRTLAGRKRKVVYREPTDEELDEELKQEQAFVDGEEAGEAEEDKHNYPPSSRNKRYRSTLSPPPKTKKPTQADRTCPHCGKHFAILSGLIYHIGECVKVII